ncbi:MAG TPA: hypothetical protein VK763_06100 [Terriglobales bacterium]|jgi:hypothetical protein|nr:hypothetical protein [Terriglobales bacterium]
MPKNPWRVISLVVCLTMMAVIAGCGGATSAPISGFNPLGEISVTITPPVMTVGTTTTQTFTAVVNNSGQQAVQWEVNGLPGGAPIIGTIDSSGDYTAPQFVPNPPTVTITAVANADSSKSGNATATITGTLFPAQVFMSPAGTAYVQAGTQLKLSGGVVGPADTSVDWQVNGVPDGNSELGTIARGANNTAVYTAPTTVPNPPTVTIKALSHSEPSKFTYNKVTLSEQPPTIATVTVTPVLAVDQAQTNFTFTADVINASDDSVSWQVDGEPGGSLLNGTIGSPSGSTGFYTAPAQVPPLGSTVTVTAVSNAQPTRSSAASLTISPPPPLGIAVELTAQTNNILTGASTFFNATVKNTSVQTVIWQVNGITGGNSTVGTIRPDAEIAGQGDYVAPTTVPDPPVVIVGAIPTANTKVETTVPLTISAPTISISLVCYPNACMNGTEQLGINDSQQFLLQTSGLNSPNATWYVCTQNSNPSNCVLGGNATLGTISPDQASDLVTYTAPASVPTPSTVIIKAVPTGAPSRFATATVMISPNQISVQVTPPGPLSVQTMELGGPFTANVIGSSDQTVSWYVNNILNGNSTVGIMQQDSQNLNQEDYIAPNNVPNPATVMITAVPEADPSVVSNTVLVTVIPQQNNITIQISPDPPPPLLPGQSNPNFTANVNNSSNQTVNWTLSPQGGGVCTTGLPTPCGTINPGTTDGNSTTYTAPDVQGLPDPYFVNITATAQVDNSVQQTVTQEITQNAQASISITASQSFPLMIQAGSPSVITFGVSAINIPDFSTDGVNWEMSCNSLAPPTKNGNPPGENCGPQPNFGQCYADGGGPGLIDYAKQQIKLCGSGDFNAQGGDTFTWLAPKILANSQGQSIYMQVQQCNTSQGQTDGFVAMTVEINGIPNCPGQNGTCQASACINISPPGAK